MKPIAFFLFVILCKIIPAQESVVIVDINIIPISTNTIMLNQDVFIEKGIIKKIVAHNTNDAVFKGFKIINGSNKYLMPGLADMHVHLPDGSEPITLQQTYNYYLQNGVTALRSMRGEKFHPQHRDSINSGLIKAPILYISYPLPEKDSSLTKKELDLFIKYIKSNKYDFVKYLNGLSDKKMAEVAKALKDNKIVIAGHCYKDVKTSLKMGFKSIEHISPIMNEYNNDSLNFDKVLIDMKKNNLSFCPTESFSQIVGFQYSIETNMNRNGMKIIDSTLANQWKRDYIVYLNRAKLSTTFYLKQNRSAKMELDAFHALLRRMFKANINILLSPDNCLFNVPGYAMVEEMKLYRDAGIDNYNILKSATLNAANFFNQSKKWGTIDKGKDATLIILDKNPMEDIENIKSVNSTLIKGKVLFTK